MIIKEEINDSRYTNLYRHLVTSIVCRIKAVRPYEDKFWDIPIHSTPVDIIHSIKEGVNDIEYANAIVYDLSLDDVMVVVEDGDYKLSDMDLTIESLYNLINALNDELSK